MDFEGVSARGRLELQKKSFWQGIALEGNFGVRLGDLGGSLGGASELLQGLPHPKKIFR